MMNLILKKDRHFLGKESNEIDSSLGLAFFDESWIKTEGFVYKTPNKNMQIYMDLQKT